MTLDEYKKLADDLDSLGDELRNALSNNLLFDREETKVSVEGHITNHIVYNVCFILHIKDRHSERTVDITFDTGGLSNTYIFLRSVIPSSHEDEYDMCIQIEVYNTLRIILESYLEHHLLLEGEY